MKELSIFISEHRKRFKNEHNNMFTFSWSKVIRRLDFLKTICNRHKEVSFKYIPNIEKQQQLASSSSSTMSTEQHILLEENIKLTSDLHLQIESGYLFSKIILDDITRAIEYYFGSATGLPLDSHDDFTKNIQKYSSVKDVKVSESFIQVLKDLKREICDFRDYQIAHEKSPRTMFGTYWDKEGNITLMLNRLYPKESDEQFQSKTPEQLLTMVESYIKKIITLIKENETKTELKLESNSV